jgi:hypothetical protein
METLTDAGNIDPILWDALKGASKGRLFLTLTKIIKTDPDAAAIASSLLLAESKQDTSAKRKTSEVSTSAEEQDVATSGVLPAKKVKRYEVCVQCDEEFDITNNNAEACQWHPGRSKPNVHVLKTDLV